MSWMDSVTDWLEGTDELTETSIKTLNPLDKDSQGIWDDFMSSYKNLSSTLKGKQASDTSAFNTYKSAMTKAGDTYGSTLKSLMDSISSGKNDLGFSLGGGNAATFTPKSVRSNATTLADLAKSVHSNETAVPAAQYAFDTSTNDYMTELSYYNILSSLAKEIKDRQAKLANTVTNVADTSKAGFNDVLGAFNNTMNMGSTTGQGMGNIGSSLQLLLSGGGIGNA
jgi:hypothetical protein